jgi:hypothetical protein
MGRQEKNARDCIGRNRRVNRFYFVKHEGIDAQAILRCAKLVIFACRNLVQHFKRENSGFEFRHSISTPEGRAPGRSRHAQFRCFLERGQFRTIDKELPADPRGGRRFWHF